MSRQIRYKPGPDDSREWEGKALSGRAKLVDELGQDGYRQWLYIKFPAGVEFETWKSIAIAEDEKLHDQ